MNYAPIIIPTCNRIIHLKRLIESLKNNNWAQYTDLYISVDVPPEERFVDGYEEVVEYVNRIDGFKSVNSFIQSNNLGPYKNFDFLIDKISGKYDRFISLEDDNEVSTNFIEYMDKMLDYFDDDPSVYAICARNDDKAYRGNGTYYMCQIYSPYGCGQWIDKYNKMKTFVSDSYFDSISKSLTKCFKLWKNSELQFNYLAGDLLGEVSPMRNTDGSIAAIDITTTIVMILENMKCAYPSVNTSRNWGDDGSGVHSGANEMEKSVFLKELNTDTGFSVVDGTQQEETFLMQKRRAQKIRRMALKTNVRSWIVVIAYNIFPDKMFNSIRCRVLKKS